MNKIRHYIHSLKKYKSASILFFLLAISVASLTFYIIDFKNLPYADSISRLNISRKVIDNLNPGLAQLGNVWLPLPQVLMLPFIWNDFMWHTGLAGALMSMGSYILGGYFLYKSAYLLTKSFLPSFFTLCIFALNVNVLYLQTTAMSELLFICCLSAVIYYFLTWVNTNQRKYLIFAGVSVSCVTLIRYEGLALLLSSILLVCVYSIFKSKSSKRLQGDLILYTVVACFGFGLWTIYLAAIFHNPFFWLGYYGFHFPSLPFLTTATETAKVVIPPPQAKPFMAAIWEYFTSVTWMSGLIPIVFAGLGLVIAAYKSLRNKSWNIAVLLLPFSIFFVMVLTLQRNTPIVQPDLNMNTIRSTETSLGTGFNIRYGIMLLPWLALLSVYLFNLRKPFYIPCIIFFCIFGVQLYNSVDPHFTAIYEIPRRIYGKPDSDMVNWMRQNYDGGYIMMSASGFEDQMFAMGFPYRTYIHEGAGKYWTEALDRPARYADWIIVDFNRPSDWLAREFKHKEFWSWDYNKVWQGESVQIYKIKTKPDIIIPGKPQKPS